MGGETALTTITFRDFAIATRRWEVLFKGALARTPAHASMRKVRILQRQRSQVRTLSGAGVWEWGMWRGCGGEIEGIGSVRARLQLDNRMNHPHGDTDIHPSPTP